MAISKSAKLAREKRVLRRMEQIDVNAKTAELSGKAKQMTVDLFQKSLDEQKKYVQELEDSK